jgi:hypothetical protein
VRTRGGAKARSRGAEQRPDDHLRKPSTTKAFEIAVGRGRCRGGGGGCVEEERFVGTLTGPGNLRGAILAAERSHLANVAVSRSL